jgi:hypothetical protein
MSIHALLPVTPARKALLSFSGWCDAGYMTQHLMGEITRGCPCEPLASWDLDGFWKTDSQRPQVDIRHGRIQSMQWPSMDFVLGKTCLQEPVILGFGPEPSSSWRRFADELLRFLQEWGCQELYLLGSIRDQIFHDEIVISAVGEDSEGLNRIVEAGCLQIDYQGPAAVHSAIIAAARPLEIRTLSIWAHVPFYLQSPHELVMVHLCRLFDRWLNIKLETRHLMDRWRKRQREIEELIDQSAELRKILDSMARGAHLRTDSALSSKVVRLEEFLKKRQGQQSDPEE